MRFLFVSFLFFGLVATANAGFPGENGSLVVARSQLDTATATPTPTAGPYPTPTPAPPKKESGLYELAPDGKTTRLTDFENELWPMYGPDGRSIVFIWAGRISFVAPGLYSQTLTGLAYDYFPSNPSWSPDGKQILFDAVRQMEPGGYSGPDVYVVEIATGDVRRLIDRRSAREAAWSPDGSRIAFIATTGSISENSDLYTVAADGSDLRNLTKTPQESEYRPDWAPDGTRLVYDTGDRVRTIAADGTGHVDLMAGSGGVYSPDGTTIAAIVEGPEFVRHVFTVPAIGGMPTQITSDPRFSDEAVSWGRVPDPLPSPTPTPSASPSPTATATTIPPAPPLGPVTKAVARQLAKAGIRGLLRGAKLTVTPPGPGRLTVEVLRSKRVLARGSGAGPFTVRRTKDAVGLLRKRKKIAVDIVVSFAGTNGSSARGVARLSLRQPRH